MVGFEGFGQQRIVPEGMGQRVEDDQARVHSRLQVSAVKVGRAAEQQVAAASVLSTN